MKEQSSKRREWIKTAAIIFLSILLVLTFFSQTILNHSLPEVATKYIQSGSITTKIRGSGPVESGDPYVIEIPATYVGRKVSGISFKVGDKVEKGDVLMTLAEGDGTELEAARESLKMAEETLKSAQDAYDTAILTAGITKGDISTAKSNINAATYRQMITEKQEALKAAKDKLTPLETAVAQLDQAISDINTQIGYEDGQKSLAASKVSTAQTALSQAQAAQTKAATDVTDAQTAKDAASSESEALEAAITAGTVAEEEIETKRAEAAEKITKADATLTEKKKALEDADKALENAQKSLNDATKDLEAKESSQSTNNLTAQKSEYEMKKYNYEKQLTAAKAEAETIQNELNELIGKINDVMNLQGLSDKIDEARKALDTQKKKVAELEGENGGSEIKSDIAGTITSVNVTSGKTIESRDVMVMQPEGQGYFMSFSVTNEQAKMLSIGDKASLVNSWYYNNMDITLKSIKPDRNDPAKSKMLTFSVDGEVAAGQTLNVSVGQKSQNYDYIIPASALKNDNNGDYVLIVESKSSPLGNRYIATRVDVQVLAKDDTQVAISGGISGWEYVITTASAPVRAGDQVRLAEN